MKRAGAAATALERLERRPTLWLRLWRFAQLKPLGAIGGALVLFMVLLAVLAPVVAPQDPLKMHYDRQFAAPGVTNLLGADNFGRDVLSRLIHGARVSVYVSFLSVAVGTGLGALVGLLSGFYAGRLDFVLQRIIDVMQAFPVLILALTIMAALGISLQNVIIAISIVFIPSAARVVRSAALSIREAEYVQAARAIGARAGRIAMLHVLPNCMAPYIIIATASLGTAVVVEASLSFLGLGVPPPEPSWGSMLSSEGREYIQKAPWITVFPGIAITLTVYGFNLLGDALRDVWDPRLRRG
ncbi:MAG: ABC transporter permease [Chloroflexi bacterium]|nr:ABC transporter permease [Chloroflexota bacterium]